MGCIITVHILLVGSGIIIVCIVILLSARVSSFVNDPVAAVFTFSRCEVEVFVPPPLPSVVPFFVVVLLQSVTVIKAIVQFETDVPPSSLVVEAIVLFLSKIAFKWLGNIYAHQKSADGTITVAYCPTKEMVLDYLLVQTITRKLVQATSEYDHGIDRGNGRQLLHALYASKSG